MKDIKAVVFDAYGTLFDVTSIAGACRDKFGEAGNELCALWRDKQLEYTWLRSLMGRYEDFRQVTADALRYSCGRLALEYDESWVESMMERYDHLETYHDVRPALEKLSGVQLVILSNGTTAMLEAVTASNGLVGIIDKLISVQQVGIFKPDPRVYALACQQTSAAPGEIAFVSSNYFDIAGASSYGLNTYWINRRDATPDILGVEGVTALETLGQLPGRLVKKY